MTGFVNKLKEINEELDLSSDVASVRWWTTKLIEALIEGIQQLNNQIDTLEQKLEKHRREGHGTTRL